LGLTMGFFVGPFFNGSGKYLRIHIAKTAIIAEPMKVVKAKKKFSSRALFNAPNNNHICILINRICNKMIPVKMVFVLLGCASFWDLLKSLIFLNVLRFLFLYIYLSVPNHHFELRQRSWRRALQYLSGVGTKPSVMTGAFYFILVFSISHSTGQMGTFLFKRTPFIFFQMN